MKRKISISVDEITLAKIKKGISEGYFRSTSHAFELCLNRVMRDE